MAIKRKRGTTPKYAKKTAWKKNKKSKPNIKSLIKSALSKNIETKTSVSTCVDGLQIYHNNFETLDGTVLYTSQGVADPMNTNQLCRIGDEINLKGISMKMMFELNERYTDVTIRIMVVKAAKGDTPTRATLFTGLAGNKMLDTINKERYTVLAQKWLKIKTTGTGGFWTELAAGEGNNQAQDGGYPKQISSRATKIVKMWIPGSKFVRSGKIQYENGGGQPKFFDYHVLAYAYSNWSTYQDTYYVARVNDYIKTMYFKDA